MLRTWLVVLLLSVLGACAEAVPSDRSPTILVIGDSMLASNSASGQAVADVLETLLGREVIDRSVPGARYFYALPISGAAGLRLTAQYRDGPWEAIVVNGGGNDLLFGCGCGKCDRMLSRLISPDGSTGAIPDFVRSLRASGAVVIYVGYLRNPGVQTPIKACGPAGNELDRRLEALDAKDPGMLFLKMSDLVPSGDRSFHQVDLIHPSVKGSQAIARRIAEAIRQILDNRPN